MRFVAPLIAVMLLAGSASAQQSQPPSQPTFNFSGMTADDIEKIGSGLGKLPRESTDEQHGNLWGRLQTQITQQVNERIAKAKADADKAVADAAAKPEAPKPNGDGK